MHLPDDDEIYTVDQTYLGPPGKFVGRYRYRAILVGSITLPLGLAFLARSGIGYNLGSVGLLIIGNIWLAGWIVDHTSQERSLQVLCSTLWHELNAPRLPHRGQRTKHTRAFKVRTTRIGDAHELPRGRRRWRSYAHRAAVSKGE